MAHGPLRIALIMCSTRSPRVGPSIASWVESTIREVITTSTMSLTVLDLAKYPLPISPIGHIIPAELPRPLTENAYTNEAVNSWSKEVASYSGFIFLTPQYNWSFPAVVKCAIDHLYQEWNGKPALIISYSKRGGSLANAQLRQVLSGVRMVYPEGKLELCMISGMASELSNKGILDEEVLNAWETGNEKKELLARWSELAESSAVFKLK